MDRLRIDPLYEEESRERKQYTEDGVLDAARRLLIGVYGHDQVHPECGGFQIVSGIFPLLGIAAVQIQYLPFRHKAAVLHRTQVGKIGAGKAWVGPGRGDFHGTGFAERHKEKVLRSLEPDRSGKIDRGGGSGGRNTGSGGSEI